MSSDGPGTGRAGARSDPVLAVDSLSARYGRGRTGALALDGVDFEVRPGEILGIVGQSGSGKTTIARCVAGLQPLASGRIHYNGRRLAERRGRVSPPRLRGIQMAFQDPASTLNPRRTVGSVFAEILRVHRLVPPSRIRDRSIELMASVGLDGDVLDRLPREMSGGMCQRAAIARALALEPRVLIADEIVSALDGSVQAQVLNLVRDLCDRSGIAVVFITHDLAVVNQICDSVVVMQDGRAVERGTTEAVLRTPASEYTVQLLNAVVEPPEQANALI